MVKILIPCRLQEGYGGLGDIETGKSDFMYVYLEKAVRNGRMQTPEQKNRQWPNVRSQCAELANYGIS